MDFTTRIISAVIIIVIYTERELFIDITHFLDNVSADSACSS